MLSPYKVWIFFVLSPPPAPSKPPLHLAGCPQSLFICTGTVVALAEPQHLCWNSLGRKKPGKYSKEHKSSHLRAAAHAQSLSGKLRRCLVVHVGEESCLSRWFCLIPGQRVNEIAGICDFIWNVNTSLARVLRVWSDGNANVAPSVARHPKCFGDTTCKTK